MNTNSILSSVNTTNQTSNSFLKTSNVENVSFELSFGRKKAKYING